MISPKMLSLFWTNPRNPDSESPLRGWYQSVKEANWTCFADIRNTYGTADLVGKKVVFNVGGNKYRVIAVIDYEGHKVFICFVLNHGDYDEGRWKDDTFGQDWEPRPQKGDVSSAQEANKNRPAKDAKSRRRKGRPQK